MVTRGFLSSVAFWITLTAALATREPLQHGLHDVFTLPAEHFRGNDAYYTVNVTLDGQTLPVLLDTGSGDFLVVGNECNTTDPQSGCYKVRPYQITPSTRILNESFFTVVGLGSIYGVDSLQSLSLSGHQVLSDFAVPLINSSATRGEFQDGQMSGILGLSNRNVSRNWYFNHRLPLIDTLLKDKKLAKPLFSITLSRFGDPDSVSGALTIGGLPDLPAAKHLAYSNLIDTLNYNYQPPVMAPQGWTVQLTGIRMNNKLVPMTRGSLDPDGRYLSLLDSGSSFLRFRYYEYQNITAAFNGSTYVDQRSNGFYFECANPQLLELRYGDVWFPIDPLDLIVSGGQTTVNGTEMCLAALGEWDFTFGDSINGPVFLKNALSVHDYVNDEALSVQPRIGLAPLTDAAAAVARYPGLYRNRLD